ncbi:alpha-2,8-polysialyltransferase family protein [Microbulbifer sp. OS29]|uniref:Alpha-2,8-polysialyltransferase family protein n=1 Tax=Microbulbifer okhotskensis TaxID=2926617 RepID=A0A9X2EQG3_9GAMM|nr:alpha-2,8-polysialyltransferase family protein [Microbulbifer okhotskensis]MCO1335934.1 alpha-2,8-polysialyltransferase family protein [Microbulbifer okhotskensis]
MRLFVVSHLLQFHQAVALIKKKSWADCKVVILYTKRNYDVPSSIKRAASEDFPGSLEFLELPDDFNRVSIGNMKLASNIYGNLILTNGVSGLYVFSFEGHYAILCSIARSSGASINLIEEGTATYKLMRPKEYLTRPTFYGSLKRSFVEVFHGTSIFDLVKFIRGIFVDLVRLPILIYKFLHSIYKSEYAQERIAKFCKTAPSSYFSFFKSFDSVYVEFPGLAKRIFHFNESEEFSVQSSILESFDFESYESENAVLFLGQRYPIPYKLYSQIIVETLLSIEDGSETTFIIKPHPKEDPRFLSELLSVFDILCPGVKCIILDQDAKVPAEKLILTYRPKKIVSIASSVLMYMSKHVKNVRDNNLDLICISDYAINEYKDRLTTDCKHLIFSHGNILKNFPNIKFI